MADLGYDLSCVSDLDPTGRSVSARRTLAESLVRRLTTPRGRLIDDANYGFDLTQFLNADMTPLELAQLKASAEAECLKDERVVSASVSFQFTGNVLILTILVQDGGGPFTLVAAVSAITATILSASL